MPVSKTAIIRSRTVERSFTTMVQSVGGPNSYYSYAPAPSAAPSAPTGGGTPYSAYQSDAYSGGSYASPVSMAASGSISAIVSDPGAASRFSLFLINSP